MFQIGKYSFKRTLARVLLVGICVLQGLSAVTPVSPVLAASAPNILNYQGRVLNANGIPVTDTSLTMIFEFYTSLAGGTCVWSNSSATCASATGKAVTLTDGLFTQSLGDTTDSFAAIGDDIFGDNAALFLQVTIAGEVLTPRKQMVAAPYALNSETLDGLNADTDGATSSAIVALSSAGNVIFTGDSTGATVDAGVAYINPAAAGANETLLGIGDNGTERFRIDKEGDVFIKSIELDGVGTNNVTSGASLIGTFNEFSLSAGTTVQDVLDDLDQAIDDIVTGGAVSKWTDDGTFTYLTSVTDDFVLGDSTIAGASLYFDVGTGQLDLGTDEALGGILRLYSVTAATADPTLAADASGNLDITTATVEISGDLEVSGGDITTAAATLNLAATNATTVNAFAAATTLNINDAAVTSTIDIGGVTSSGTNTVNIATNATAADGITIGNSHASTTLALTGGDDWSIAATGVMTLSASAAATTAIVITDTDYTNSLSIGDNNITGTTYSLIGTTSTIDFTNFDVASTGAITVAAGTGLDTNGAGALALGNTNATSVSVCNSAACDTISIGTNADADAITIGDSSDTVIINGTALSLVIGATTVAGAEITILDGGIALSELTDSGTLTATTVDINGGAIDGTAIGASSPSTGAFTTLSSTGVTALGNNSATVAINSSDWDISATGAMTGIGAITADGLITGSAGLTVSGGNITTSAAQILGASPFVFEGATDDDVTTTFAITDPTGARTITFQNASGTVAFLTDTVSPTLTDNVADALDIQEGTNNYININTTDASESIAFGNATTNPSFSFLGSGTVTTAGDIALNGGDLTSSSATFNLLATASTTVNAFAAATTLNINDAAVTSTIDIGGVTSSGTNTVNIATNATAADVITIGNSHVSTTVALTGGDDWSIAATGVMTLSASASATTAIVITDTDYTNSLSIGDNNITGTTYSLIGTTSTIDFTNFDVASTGAITVAAGTGLDTNGAGALALGNTNATSVSVCNSAACDTISIGTNTDADAINIGDTNDTVTISGTSLSLVIGATTVSDGEITILDGGIALSELTDSGTLTATTVDINGGAIDGTAIGANSPSSGAFTTLSSTGVTALGNNSATVAINSSDWDISATGAMTGIGAITADGLITGSAGLTVSGGNITTSAAQILGASPFVFEGATDDDVTTTFAITDPTGARTITFQNASGTVAFLTDTLSSTLTDNITDSLDIQEGTNNYININTTDASESIAFGNATTNPSFSFLGSGTVTTAGDIALNGGDLTSSSATFNLLATASTTVNAFAAATTLNINDAAVTSTIDIGGVDSSGTNTVNIATNSTAADVITIGNTNASTTLALTGGDDWSIAATGVMTLSASAAATTAIVITDTDYTNSLSIGDNNITGTTYSLIGTTSTINFTNFDVASTGAITVAAGTGLDTNGAGALALGNTNATSVSVCNSAACDTISIGTNADADAITIGDSSDTVIINGTALSLVIGATTVAGAEITILDGGIALSELTDSGTLTATTVDINGGAIDGTAIGAASPSTGAFTTLSSTGNVTLSSAQILGASPLVFEGVTDDNVTTTFAITDPTGARTITFQNASGTVAFLTDTISPTLTDNTSDALDIQEGTNNYININTTNTSENIAFGNATTNPSFSFLGSGTVTTAGDIALNGGDLTSSSATFNLLATASTTVNAFAAATTLNINDAAVTSTIDIGGVTSSGTNTINIATNATAADAITIGNTHVDTALELRGGDDWSIASSGVMTLSASASATTAIVVTDTDYTNALSIGDNNITGTTYSLVGTTATINFTNFDLSGTGDITVAANGGLDTNGAGSLLLGGTNATTVSVCNSAACDNFNLATNADADIISIGDSMDSLALSSANWSITTAGLITTADDLALNGGDLTSSSATFNLLATASTTVNAFAAATTLNLNDAAVTSTIHIGGVTSSGTNTVNIATNGTAEDEINIGNTNAATSLELIGGDDWSIANTGVMTLSTSSTPATAIVATDTGYTNALSIGDNNITGTTYSLVGTTSTIDFTNFDVASTGAITVAAGTGLDTNGAGALAIGNTNATSVSVCNSAACDTITIGTNADADAITIGDSSDSVSAVSANWSITTAGLITTADDLALNGGDLTSSSATFNLLATASTTVNTFAAATTLNINDAAVTSTIDIGGVTSSGTNTVNIATNSTAADVITIGNTNASTTLALTGGDDWSIAATGVMTLSASASATTAIVITDTDYTNSLSIGDNNITGTTYSLIGTTSTINFTNFDVASTGAITVAAGTGLDTNGAGALALGNTNATSVSVCNSAACDTISIGTNTDADAISIGDANDTLAIDTSTWSVTTAGAASFSTLATNSDVNFNFTTASSGTENFVIASTHATDATLVVQQIGMTNTAAADTGTNYLLALTNENDGGATGTPDALLFISQDDTNEAVASGILFDAAGGGLTTAIMATDAQIDTALSVGANDIVGTTGLINYTNFDVASTGAITVAAGTGLDTNGAGALALGNTNATSVSVCNSAACDTFTIGTNTDADAITIGDTNDTLTIGALTSITNNSATTSEAVTITTNGLTSGRSLIVASTGEAATTGTGALIYVSGTRTSTGTISGHVLDVTRQMNNSSGGLLSVTGDLLSILSNNSNTSGTLTDSATLLNVEQSNTGATGSVLNIGNNGTGSAIFVTQDNATGTTVDTTAGGAIHVDNTGNDNYGLTVYSDNSAASSPLAYFFADHTTFASDVVAIRNDSSASALVITQNTVANATVGANSQALVINVNEAANSEEVIVIISDADGTPDLEFRFENDGDLFGDGATYNAGADYAEFFYTLDSSLTDHQVVCQDTLNNLAVKKCGAGDKKIVGVVSVQPGFVGNNIPGADGNLDDNPNYRIVGLEGQIDTYVTAADGPIAVGDALTTSAVTAGYAGKASAAGRVVGYALQPMAAGSGLMTVRVSPGWDAGNVITPTGGVTSFTNTLALESLSTATAAAPASHSNALAFRGSAWNGSAAQTVAMTLSNKVTSSSSYKLSVANDAGAEVAYINNLGDLVLSGKLYPSNQGVAQTSAYIYYDSSGVGYMRTNAAGWGVGSYDFAELFPSPQVLTPGEVVVFGDGDEQVKRSTGATYDDRIAGVVSTRPGFLAGTYKPGDSPIALSGRVPTKVNTQNGSIAIGDPLTTSSTPGVAMKATQPGPIVGYALQNFSGTNGMISVFIRASYYDGDGSQVPAMAAAPVSGVGNTADLTSLSLNGGPITSVASITGLGNTWRLTEIGDFITRGRVVQLVKSHQNEDVETYMVAAREMTIQLSGTATLSGNTAVVTFDDIDPQFNDVISTMAPYRVLVTPSGVTGQLYVTNRTTTGFTISAEGAANGVIVDWLVIAYHKDYEPTPTVATDEPVDPQPEEVVPPEPEVAGEATETTTPSPSVAGGEGEVTEEPVIETPVDEPIVEPETEEPATETTTPSPSVAGGEGEVTEEPPVEESAVTEPEPEVTPEVPVGG
ncbi:MAG: hypothetical protein WAZ14_01420 [Patescibacteria group bacterium]